MLTASAIALAAIAAAAGAAGAATVAAGVSHSCAIARSGEVYCWGANTNGQLGDGSTTTRSLPVRVTGPVEPTALAAGTSHTCALLADGSVQCWGANANGQLGDGTTTQSTTPVAVSGIIDAVQITAGASHTCALLGDRTATCWGANANGQLGDGTTTQRTAPTPVTGLTSGTSIAAGDSHTCAVVSGSAYCWGLNANGQIGDGTTTQRTSPTPVSGVSSALQVTAGAGHSCALSATVQCWGLNTNGQLGDGTTTQRLSPVTVGSLSGVVRLSAGGSHTCAVESTPAVKCWGLNTDGQIGDGNTTQRATATVVSGLSATLSLDAGGSHNCAVTGAGVFECWGAGSSGQIGDGSMSARGTPAIVSGLAGVIAMAVGTSHSCAALANGPAPASRASYCWGADGSGQLGDSDTSQKVLPTFTYYVDDAFALAGGQTHSCAVLTGGQAKCWGKNDFGQAGTGTTGASYTTAQDVSGLSTAVDIAAGSNHSCAIASGGQARCWGANSVGQIGDGTTTAKNVPTNVSGLTTATKLSAGGTNSCAIVSGGQAKCWGKNDVGQTGNGNTTTPQSAPVNVSGVGNAVAIATGVNHSCAIVSGGTVKCWGNNGNGQLGNNSTTASSTPVNVSGVSGATTIELGDFHSCAVVALGAVKCWGAGGNGQLGDGLSTDSLVPVDVSGLLGVKSVAAGGNQTCAVTTDGHTYCWGFGLSGQLGNGTTANRSTPTEVNLLDAYVKIDNIPEGAFLQNAHPSIGFSTLDSISPILECNFDNGGWNVCNSPYDPGVLATGRHRMQVRATAGDTGLLSYTSVSFAVGVTMPTVTINSPSSGGVTNDATPSVAFDVTGTNPLNTECQVDAGAFVSCATGYTTAALSEGAHTVTVRVTDGNSNTASAAVTFTVDTTAPNTTIDSGPPSAFASTNASFSFSANESATFQCSLDGAAYTSCISPQTPSGLAQGAHGFSVRASDAAGNTDATPATHNWTVDSVGPAVSIGAPVNGSFSGDSTPALSFSVTEANSYTTTCSVDGGAYAACSSASSLAALADGAHTRTVRATDAAGNQGSAATAFTVDTVVPAVTIVSPADLSATASTAPPVSFTVTDATSTTVECRVDAGGWTACASPHVPSPALANGAHGIDVRATDQAGQVGSASISITVDTTLPTVTISAPANGVTTADNTAQVTFGTTGGTLASRECKIDGGGFVACTSGSDLPAVADGAHALTVRVTDTLARTATDAVTYTVDSVNPVVTISTPAPGATIESLVSSIAFSAVDATATTFQCSIDGGAFAGCTSPFAPTLAAGAHSVSVRATDAATNQGSSSVSFTLAPPAPPALAPGSGTAPAPPADSAPAPVAFTPALFAVKKATKLKLVLLLNPPSGLVPSCSGTVQFSGTLIRAKIKAAAALKLASGKCVATATAKVKRTLRGRLKLTAAHAGTQQIAPVKFSKTLKVR